MEAWQRRIQEKKEKGEAWTDEERAALAQCMDDELEKRLEEGSKGGGGRPEDCWTEDNWREVRVLF